MKINLSEITKLIDEQLSIYEPQIDEEEIGKVLDIRDGIAKISGLSSVMMNELLQFENGIMGIALNLSEDSIGAIILGEYTEIYEGSSVRRTKNLLSIPVGKNFLGRVINPLGEPLDGLGEIKATTRRPIEISAPGVVKRQPVNVPLQTGIKSIDAMIPIGRGQRELIIGDRQTGKTAVCVDTIINQKDTGVICIYIAIGQKASTVASVVEKLKQHDAMKHTIVVTTTANDEAPLLYIAPYAGCAMAEYFMYEKHRDTLCVYDDLTKQANAYRQISLLLQRPPGREAFPGDVFYLHSRLLERSAKLSDEEGGGSLTALPIIETQEGEVAAYIPTNVISITDGQIYLRPDLFASGVRPAVDVGISVSRVGGNAQISAMKQVAGSLRLDMAQFKNLEAFAQLATDMDETTRQQLNRGYRLTEILKQGQYKPMAVEEQICIIFAGVNGLLDELPVSKVTEFEEFLIKEIRKEQPELLDSIVKTKKIQNKETLLTVIQDMVKQFKRSLN